METVLLIILAAAIFVNLLLIVNNFRLGLRWMRLNGLLTVICIHAWRMAQHNNLRAVADLQLERARRTLQQG